MNDVTTMTSLKEKKSNTDFQLIRCAQEIVKYGQLVAKLSREIAAKVKILGIQLVTRVSRDLTQ